MRRNAGPYHRKTEKVLSLDEVTFAPGNGQRQTLSERWEYSEVYNVDFGGVLDKQGRPVGYEVTIRSPDLTAKDYSDQDPRTLDKWWCQGHQTRDNRPFGGAASSKFLDDRNACVALAKKLLAQAYKTSVAKFGAPAKLASRVVDRYLAQR